MRSNIWVKMYALISMLGLVVYACTDQPVENKTVSKELSLDFMWFRGSFGQSLEEMKTGLAWGVSTLGATLPKGSMDDAFILKGDQIFTFDFSKVGFTKKAEKAIQQIIKRIKFSDFYQKRGYADLGRFFALTLNSPYHYYEITDMPYDLEGFKSAYSFEGKQMQVIKSGVSKVERLVLVAEAKKFEEIAYLCAEGTGSFADTSYVQEEFEAMDFMSNGQLRFALYDKEGNLKDAASDHLSFAGKPSKCLWCHETNIQPLFQENPVNTGKDLLSVDEFHDIRENQIFFLAEYRGSLNSDIDFSNKQGHAHMEHIYIDFMEPSLQRIALEWNMPKREVSEILKQARKHEHEEFGFEELYERFDVDHYSPTKTVKVPESARESSKYEPDFFAMSK